MRTPASESDSHSDLIALAIRAGLEGGRQALAEFRENGGGAPKEWLTAQDLANEGPYSEPTICTFKKEGRGPRDIQCGNYRLTRRDWWNEWILRGGPSAYDKLPNGKYRLKPEFQMARRVGAQEGGRE